MKYVTRSPAISLVSHETAFKGQEASAGSEFNVKGESKNAEFSTILKVDPTS